MAKKFADYLEKFQDPGNYYLWFVDTSDFSLYRGSFLGLFTLGPGSTLVLLG
jgi:hypothetical protein